MRQYYAHYNKYGIRTIGGSMYLSFDSKDERNEFVVRNEMRGSNIVAESCTRKDVEVVLGSNFFVKLESWEFIACHPEQVKICHRR